MPVFVGRSEDGELIRIYKRNADFRDLHIRRGDGELWAINPEAVIVVWSELDTFHVEMKSPQWTGKAKGTRYELIAEDKLLEGEEKEVKEVPKFAGRKGDLVWGKYDYPVTFSQKASLDGLWNLMQGLPRALDQLGRYALPQGGFYSQNPNDGGVIIGLLHQSVTVHRTGRITSNQ